jgi:hypothetical protein
MRVIMEWEELMNEIDMRLENISRFIHLIPLSKAPRD